MKKSIIMFIQKLVFFCHKTIQCGRISFDVVDFAFLNRSDCSAEKLVMYAIMLTMLRFQATQHPVSNNFFISSFRSKRERSSMHFVIVLFSWQKAKFLFKIPEKVVRKFFDELVHLVSYFAIHQTVSLPFQLTLNRGKYKKFL